MTSQSSALVTGATRGIGAAIAAALAADGHHVRVAGRDAERGRAVVERLRRAGGSADFLPLDLDAEPDAVRAELERALPRDDRPIDVLVNNAAVYPVGPSEQLADVDATRLLRVNVLAPHVLVSALAPAMAGRGRGAIVNVASWMGRVGTPAGALYSATKAAVEQLTRSWAAEYGPRGVRVNGVAPGVTLTEGNQQHREVLERIVRSTPAGALVRPDDVAAAVAFLASPAARMVHGAVVPVDGGIGVTRS